METPSSTFRLERVRSLRERAKEHAREELARELQLRMRGEAMLREAATQNYVRRVQAYAAEFRTASPAPTAAVSLAAAPVSSSPSVNGIL